MDSSGLFNEEMGRNRSSAKKTSSFADKFEANAYKRKPKVKKSKRRMMKRR